MDYDANPVQVYTRYSYEELKRYQKTFARKSNRLLLPVLIVFGLLVLGLLIFMFVFPDSLYDMLPGLVLIAIAVLLELAILNSWFFTKKAYANATRLFQNGSYFSFCNNDVVISTEQQDHVGQSRVAYNIIYQVWETRTMFYIYISKRQAYLISKQGFQTGSPDELRALLQRLVPPAQYKVFDID